MNLTNSLIVAIRALQRNKLRTALTSIGIIIGVSSVIMMVGIGNSARIAVRERIYSFGTNALAVMSFKHTFGDEDLLAMKEEIPEIQYITPANYFDYPVKHKSKHAVRSVIGVSNDYFFMNNWTLQTGTIFSNEEVIARDKVVVIGNTIKRELFDGQDPVGLVIHIMGIPFKVVGCLEEKGAAISGRDMDSLILGPYTTLGLKLFPTKAYVSVYVSTYTEEQIEPVKIKLGDYYRRKNSLPEGEMGDFRIASSRDALKMAEEISNILTTLLAGIASISLFVGGVGHVVRALAAAQNAGARRSRFEVRVLRRPSRLEGRYGCRGTASVATVLSCVGEAAGASCGWQRWHRGHGGRLECSMPGYRARSCHGPRRGATLF